MSFISPRFFFFHNVGEIPVYLHVPPSLYPLTITQAQMSLMSLLSLLFPLSLTFAYTHSLTAADWGKQLTRSV